MTVGIAPSLVNLPRKDVPRYLIDPEDFSGRIPEGYIHLKDKAAAGLRRFRIEVEDGFPSFEATMGSSPD